MYVFIYLFIDFSNLILGVGLSFFFIFFRRVLKINPKTPKRPSVGQLLEMADDNRRFSGGVSKGYITTVYKNLRTDFGYIYNTLLVLQKSKNRPDSLVSSCPFLCRLSHAKCRFFDSPICFSTNRGSLILKSFLFKENQDERFLFSFF